MPVRPSIAILAGAIGSAAIALFGAANTADDFASNLNERASEALEQTGVRADFAALNGWPSRHPSLSGGEDLDEASRVKAAQIVAELPGVGGIRWADGTMAAEQGSRSFTPLHCQDDVDALLRTRTIRFEESRSALDDASRELLDEVEAALRPCVGSIIAITGHTDNSGPEPGNLDLSRERADSVRNALIRRGIPRDGLRATGVGSSKPVDGLDPADPANRRIEFSVIATEPLMPTPVDTPGAR